MVRRRKQELEREMKRSRHESDPPFDAAAHFENYDHDAVLKLSSETVLCPATFERKATVEACVGATNRYKLNSKIYIHDDGSTQYDEEWLQPFGDRVFRHKHGHGGRRGVKDLRSNIVKSLLGDFKPEIFEPWLKEDFGEEGPTYLYMVDSDGYHDPHFFYRLHEIIGLYPKWGTICLYNAKFHSPKHNRPHNNIVDYDTVVRGMSAGISMFFRLQSFRDKPNKIQVPDGRGWDGFYSREIAGRKVVTSLISYTLHLGKGGFHNKGSWDRDRALNPTKFLAEIRDESIKKIESCGKDSKS